uniref:Treslin_N domain-containing protein n=1 Tax=Caenorhabditis japonica TaxID=281687 RepID=A0A8R1I3Q5_CAEJA
MKETPKIEKEVMKSFEDVAFEMLSTVSPVKLPREDIPFDSVREIVLNEIIKSKQQKIAAASNGRKNMEDLLLDEAPSSSSSSSHALHDGETSSSILERGTMTDDVEIVPRPITARLYGDCTRSSSTSTAPAPSASDTTDQRKKPSYREKRLAEIRQARLKKYRDNSEIAEFKVEENCLAEPFSKYYCELVEEETTNAANVYFRIVESLDVYFRAKTWESNCPKLLCEFLIENILKSCQSLNELHDSKNSSDERKARECQIQVLLTLHVFVVTDEKKHLDEAIHKLRMIYISVGAERLKTFVEEPVTDVYLEIAGDGLATIYDELCIALPVDLQQYDNGLFKMTETDDSTIVVKRRNGVANRLEQMLMETSAELGVELLSPSRPSRTATCGQSGRPDYKQFFVEDTPDEKYQKRQQKRGGGNNEKDEKNGEDDGDDDVEVDGLKTIEEQIEEEVKQTPVTKLRLAAKKSGNRCSKRLSDLVKLSEERSQIPRKARENLDKILEKAKASTPLRSVPRQTRKSILLGTTPTSSPLGMSTRGSARTSLLNKFANTMTSPESAELSFEETTSPRLAAAESSTPINRDRFSKRRGGPPARYREAMLTTGERSRNSKNTKINWESAQVNRAGRVKGAGASEDGTPIFGIARRNVRTMICHVLLNDTNPDTSFDWNKVKFDDIDDKPRTRSMQSLIQKPEAYMESLKQKYIEAKLSPLKRSRENPSSSSGSATKKGKRVSSSGTQGPSTSTSPTKSRKYGRAEDYGFESEADE